MRAARLLDEWAKDTAYKALVNSAYPDKGVQLYAITLQALAAQANMRAREFEASYHSLAASGSLREGSDT